MSRVVLVTGAGSGIGRATSEELARQGWLVVVADVVKETASETLSVVEACGSAGLAVRCDVRSMADLEKVRDEIQTTFGRLDGAVNSAGITPPSSPLHEASEDEWRDVFEINVMGVWRCMTIEIPLMLSNGWGSIVNVSSRTGLGGSPGRASYSASKHAVIGLTRTAALEFATRNIRVNAVCPGPISTPMLESAGVSDAGRIARLAASSAMNRLGQPQEVAQSIAWLLSSSASYITGIEVPIDGGQARNSSASPQPH